jgi:prepilin-type N-terminal cleavage/methylation domain-containing protein
MMKNERGFTIMELLVVIVIIGVLAAIGVPAYKNMTDKAKATACEANRRTMKTGVMLYYVEQGEYPEAIDADTAGKGINEYVDNVGTFECKSEGTYSTAGGEVYCTKHAPTPSGGS